MAVQQFCLRWNNHQPNFISVFTHLLSTESLVDVTLAAEGKHLQAHRVVLSACSPYFQMLFTMNPCQHPIVILKDVKYDDLKIMVDFMYYGEVNISHEQLPAILKTAELLKVKGLAENSDPGLTKQASGSSDRAELLAPGDSAWDSASRRSPSPLSIAAKRKRLRKSSTGSGSGSTERGTSEELLTGEVTLVPSPALVKTETSGFPVVQSSGGGSTDADSGGTGRSADSSLRTGGQEPSTDSEPRNGSHDSTDDDPLSIHIPPESEGSNPKVESNVSEYSQGETQSQQSHQMHISPQGKPPSAKRNRWLVRQPRVKKEGDAGQEEVELTAPAALSPTVPSPSPQVTEMQTTVVTPTTTVQPQHSPPQQLLLAVPHRVERQSSEPGPSRSCQLLTVPQTPTYLVKQHSDPQIQSVVSTHTPLLTIQRQLSQQHQQQHHLQQHQQQP
ncbi:longitudinals lacking protein, isoforms H/M/V-like, partial [Schistocerca americana]